MNVYQKSSREVFKSAVIMREVYMKPFEIIFGSLLNSRKQSIKFLVCYENIFSRHLESQRLRKRIAQNSTMLHRLQSFSHLFSP